MPKVSIDTAESEDVGFLVDRFGELDGYSVDFLTFRQDMDATALLRGLPNDQCQCPHWGYVIRGRLRYRVGDREEEFAAGDAFYLPAGHIPIENEPGSSCSSARPRRSGRCRR
jgi:Cupin domain